jgi:hypothetical protein
MYKLNFVLKATEVRASLETIDIILANDGDLFAENNRGYTPLHTGIFNLILTEVNEFVVWK